MGITMTMTGRSGKPGRPSFFPIRAHLLTTSRRPVVVLLLRISRALSEGYSAPAGAYRQCCRDCGPGHHCLREGIGAPFPSPAKTCTGSFVAEAGTDMFARPYVLFCEREPEIRIEEVQTIGNLPFGSEGHQPGYGPLRLRGFGLYELLRHL